MVAVATPDNEDHLTIERVTTGRRGPFVVTLLAAVVVGVLLWKPWDRPAAMPSPSHIAVAPTPTTTSTPTPSPTATPSPTEAPTPTAPPRTPSPTAALAEIDVRYAANGGAFVHCSYESIDGGPTVLSQVDAGPPYVQFNSLLAAARDVRRVAWRVEIQVNTLESIFSADWEPVGESRRHFASDLTSDPLAFSQVSIDYDKSRAGPTLVARVVVFVEWFGPRRALLGSREIVATNYGQGGGVLAEGCLTSLG
jgi:hypothetical protein